jgi:acetylornithine deacetylase
LQTQGNEAAENHVSKAVRQILGNCTSTAVAFGTDASTLAEHGIPSVVFGPGDIRQAHTRDEWINLSEVESAAEILFQLGSG